MMVTVGTEWASYEGTRRSYAVTLSEEDLGDQLVGLNKAEIFHKLNVAAEMMVISQAVKDGGMSTERAKVRRAELIGNG